jgi:hypothetical protein
MALGRKRVYCKRIDTSSTNIPTAFSSASTSKVITGLGSLGFEHFKILNDTSSRLAITLTDVDSGVPDSSTTVNTSQDFIASTSTEFKDDIWVYDTVYIRSDTGSAITSGIVVLEFW